MIEKPIYHLNLTMRGCLARAEINGFPVLSQDAHIPGSMAPPLNAFLVGAENVLTVEAWPSPTGPANPLLADIKGSVATFATGDIVVSGGGGDLVLPVDVRLWLAQAKIKPEFPLRARYVFDNEGPAFPALLREGEVLEDAEPLFDYAMKLRDLARASDAAGLGAEMAPKMKDYAAAYYADEAFMLADIVDFFRDQVFPARLELDFGKGDILPVRWCGGRVWELRRAGGAFFTTERNQAGGRFVFPVYVAQVDGALKVVR